jgi:Cu-Zn family superoxide dismutase
MHVPIFTSSLLLLGLVSASRKAVVDIQPDIKLANGGGAEGRIVFTQYSKHSPVKMRAELSGFEPNSIHGWHIHGGSVDDTFDCSAAGGHFNPFELTHGEPGSDTRYFSFLLMS